MTWEKKSIPGGWEYHESETKARIVVDYIVPKGTAWEAWVECRMPDTDRPLASGSLNIASPSAVRPFLQTIDDDKHPVPWKDGLLTAFYETVKSEREGAATQDLALVEAEALEFLVEPLVEEGGNTRIIAPGGSGKSFLGLAMGLTVATGSRKFLGLHTQRTGPVLYLDWETNAATHARRRDMLCHGAGVQAPGKGMLWYRFEALPLHRTMQTVARFCEREGVVMLIVDSRQTAAGASGQSSGEEAALNLHTALREIGRPSLLIDHKAKENIEKGRKGGYGSVWNTNLARMEWEFTKYQQVGKRDHVFVMSLEKGNNVGQLPPLGYRLTFTDDAATFRRVRPESVSDPTPRDSLADELLMLFAASNEPITVARLAELTGKGESTIRTALNRNRAMFENVAEQGKTGRWRATDEYRDGPQDDGQQTTLDQLEELAIPADDETPVGNNGQPEAEPEDDLPDPFEPAEDDVTIF